MAVPKRRTSKSKKLRRRAHDGLKTPTLRRDPDTDEMHISHRAYKGEDGAYYYRGRRLTPVKD